MLQMPHVAWSGFLSAYVGYKAGGVKIEAKQNANGN